jgi:hypothetical protein
MLLKLNKAPIFFKSMILRASQGASECVGAANVCKQTFRKENNHRNAQRDL